MGGGSRWVGDTVYPSSGVGSLSGGSGVSGEIGGRGSDIVSVKSDDGSDKGGSGVSGEIREDSMEKVDGMEIGDKCGGLNGGEVCSGVGKCRIGGDGLWGGAVSSKCEEEVNGVVMGFKCIGANSGG